MRQGRFLFCNLFRRHAVNRDLDAELGAYADEMNARRRHGVRPNVSIEQAREEVRSARLGAGLESCARDLRYAARMLRKAPLLTLACVATFALGIGANTVVFSMANAFLFRQPPVEQPRQIAFLQATRAGEIGGQLASAEIDRLRDQSHGIFGGVATATIGPMGLSVNGDARPMWGSYVSGNFFAVLGVRPALGQFFSAPGGTVDREPVMVLSHAYWESRFLGDRGVIGGHAVVNGRPVTIVGVAPAGFHGLSSLMDTQGYLPSGLESAPMDGAVVLMRLRPGVGLPAAEAKLAVIAAAWSASGADPADKHLRFGLTPMGTGLIDTRGGPNPFVMVSALFLTLSGLVLLLAAANIMGLLLARARVRQREMALRSALGARRGRLARQVFLETLLLAGLGCAAGLALGVVASRTVQNSVPQTSGVPLTFDFHFDWRILLFGLAMGLLMALVAGVVPAWRAAGVDPNDVLRGGQGAGLRRQWLRSGLVAGQVAVSLALLIAGGLFARSLWHARSANLGFDPAGVWNFTLDTSGAGDTPAQGQQFFATLLPRVRALPGVASASLARTEPFGIESFGDQLWIGTSRPAAGAPPLGAGYSAISPGYFATMRVPLLRGRGFAAGDDAAAPPIAVISQTMAARYWPGQNPVGRVFTRADDAAHPLRVVGIAGDVRADFAASIGPYYYLPLAQSFAPRQILQVRAGSSRAVGEVLQAVRQVDANVPVQIESMNATVSGVDGLFVFDVGARLALALGLLGLSLAAIGVYGVVAYAAAQRTREIGIRIALGARPAQVAGGIVRHALALLAWGTALGLLLALAIAKLVGVFLVDVSPFDPVTYGSAVAVLAAVVLAASLRPAWRATRADPLAALRAE